MEQELSAQELAQEARTIVLRKLNYGARTRSELAGNLAAAQIPDSVAAKVLDHYVAVGLIDDAVLAESWVTTRQRTKGSTRWVLRRELRAKGVSDLDAEAALALVTDDDEFQRAKLLIATKLRATEHLAQAVRTRRLMGLLIRRGYQPKLASSVISEALGDCD